MTPTASRKVAGGPSEASDHRNRMWCEGSTPAGVTYHARANFTSVLTFRDPAGVELSSHDITGGRSLTLGPPATLRASSGGGRDQRSMALNSGDRFQRAFDDVRQFHAHEKLRRIQVVVARLIGHADHLMLLRERVRQHRIEFSQLERGAIATVSDADGEMSRRSRRDRTSS